MYFSKVSCGLVPTIMIMNSTTLKLYEFDFDILRSPKTKADITIWNAYRR